MRKQRQVDHVRTRVSGRLWGRTGRHTTLQRLMPVQSMSLVLAMLALAVSVASGQSERALRIFVSIPPQAYFADRIAGDLGDVHVLVGPGQSPHTFDVTPRQLASLADCDVYFSIGLPFESRIVDKLRQTNTGLRIVDTSWNVPRIAIEEPGDEGAVGLPDPHTWLDPGLAEIQAGNMCDALVQISPAHSQTFQKNLAALVSDLESLDRELAVTLAPLKGSRLYVFHPAFGYFAHAYGLIQVAIEPGGVEPGPRELAAFIDRASEEGVRVIFVQPQFSPQAASTIANGIGATVVPIDPLAEDYIDNMRSIAVAVAASAREPDATDGECR
jgi:zinc transport system substrate-binding protein